MTHDPKSLRALADTTREVYERHARAFDRHRTKSRAERAWLDRFVAAARATGPILDVGCGAGEPVARYLIETGKQVVGIDFSDTMLALCRTRFPEHRWFNADMRTLDLGERFAGVMAWDSLFHLRPDEQRTCLVRLARHVAPGGALMFTCGPHEGEMVGTVVDSPVYHASLSVAEYGRILAPHGLRCVHFVPEDPDCNAHSVYLAKHSA